MGFYSVAVESCRSGGLNTLNDITWRLHATAVFGECGSPLYNVHVLWFQQRMCQGRLQVAWNCLIIFLKFELKLCKRDRRIMLAPSDILIKFNQPTLLIYKPTYPFNKSTYLLIHKPPYPLNSSINLPFHFRNQSTLLFHTSAYPFNS